MHFRIDTLCWVSDESRVAMSRGEMSYYVIKTCVFVDHNVETGW